VKLGVKAHAQTQQRAPLLVRGATRPLSPGPLAPLRVRRTLHVGSRRTVPLVGNQGTPRGLDVAVPASGRQLRYRLLSHHGPVGLFGQLGATARALGRAPLLARPGPQLGETPAVFATQKVTAAALLRVAGRGVRAHRALQVDGHAFVVVVSPPPPPPPSEVGGRRRGRCGAHGGGRGSGEGEMRFCGGVAKGVRVSGGVAWGEFGGGGGGAEK
jgi:hypothetical protein